MIHREFDIAHAAMCALVSMDSTSRSNATVGPPIEYLVYLNDTYNPSLQQSLDRDHEYWLQLRKNWSDSLRRAFDSLPIAPGLDSLQKDSATNVMSIHTQNRLAR